jgi:MFS family permease
VAIVQTTLDFEGGPPTDPNFTSKISKVAYFYTSTALCQGIGMLFWMPLIVKYGRRPIYVASFTLYVATGFWCGFVSSYGAELAGRIVMGLASGAGECLGPLTITDIFFLHERGAVMATYTAFLSMGVAGGIVIDGLITINYSWRYIYYVACALIGALTLLVVFTFPETTYKRSEVILDSHTSEEKHKPAVEGEHAEYDVKSATMSSLKHEATLESQEVIPRKISFVESLGVFTRTYTRESLTKIFIRPIALILLPSVLWCSLVFAVTIGFLVAITSNFAVRNWK